MRGNGYTDPATGRVADRRVGAPLIGTCINFIFDVSLSHGTVARESGFPLAHD